LHFDFFISKEGTFMAFKQKRSSSFYFLLGATFLLLIFGIVMIFSASSVTAFAKYGDSFYYLKRQILWASIGLILLLFFAGTDYHLIRRWLRPLLLFTIISLAVVLVPGIGKVAGGARRWIDLGVTPFQPSEFAKLSIVAYTAHLLAQRGEKMKELKHLLIPLFFPLLLAVGVMVMLQPDLGTVFTIFLSVFVLLFLSGARIGHLLGIGGGGVMGVAVLILSEGYRRQRFFSFLDPWKNPQGSGFHIIQSLIAFGSGGVTGLGLGMSRQKFFYLPAAHTDFIFAIIGEELGLIGSLSVVMLFLFLTVMGVRTAMRARDEFGKLLAAGVVTVIACQALINMAAVTGMIPITGIPLPLISSGGSSLLFSLSSIGILLNIACQERPRASGARSENSNLRGRDRRPHLSRSGTGQGVKASK
jgi:cell division protein FtsW